MLSTWIDPYEEMIYKNFHISLELAKKILLNEKKALSGLADPEGFIKNMIIDETVELIRRENCDVSAADLLSKLDYSRSRHPINDIRVSRAINDAIKSLQNVLIQFVEKEKYSWAMGDPINSYYVQKI